MASSLEAQPDNRFEPFEWVQYRAASAINSFTSDNTYLYAGTANSGILRLHLFTQEFSEPITRAQGLSGNSIKAVHSAFGFLWAASDRGLEFSFDKRGDWHLISKESLGLGPFAEIIKIGNSEGYLWLRTSTLYLKCDRTTGYLLSKLPVPDENEITWSSGTYDLHSGILDLIPEFTIWGGWLQTLDIFITPAGKEIRLITHFIDNFGDLWIGTSDGTIFYGDNTMKSLTPLTFGLAGNDIQAISGHESFWLAGRNMGTESGVTYFDLGRKINDRYEFDEIINMDPVPLFSILEQEKNIWFGGDGKLLVYHNEDYWRTLGIDRGLPSARINCIAGTSGLIWLGTSNGLWLLDPKTKRIKKSELEIIFEENFIYDLIFNDGQLWIAAGTGLFIYDLELNKLYSYRKFGNYVLDDLFMPKYSGFTDLELKKGIIYAGNKFGILAFNIKSKNWSKAVDSNIWGNADIRSFTVIDQYIIITEGKIITIFNRKNDKTIQYSFPFIGVVNNLYFSNSKLWLGTTEGLISIDWKKDR
ncbi:MAG: hypothetical protein V3S48_06670 [Candidatus Neomarinimicrobiota bacterium]